MTKSIEDMKQELEAEGYIVNRYNKMITEPNGWVISSSLWHMDKLIYHAHQHLQEQRELAALQALRDEIPHPVDYNMAMRAYTCGFCDASHEDEKFLVIHADDCVWASAMKFKLEQQSP